MGPRRASSAFGGGLAGIVDGRRRGKGGVTKRSYVPGKGLGGSEAGWFVVLAPEMRRAEKE